MDFLTLLPSNASLLQVQSDLRVTSRQRGPESALLAVVWHVVCKWI